MKDENIIYEKNELTRERLETSTETAQCKSEIVTSQEKNESRKDIRVGSIEDAPEFQKDNEYIQQGYRINFKSVKEIFRSLFMLHNESVNIWSHLLGAIFIVCLVVYTTIFIRAHKSDILNMDFRLNLTELNEDMKLATQPILKYLPNLHNFTGSINRNYENILNKTLDYIHILDEKIGAYKSYVSSYSPYDEIVENLKQIKNKLGGYKDKIVNESIHIYETIEDSSVIHFIEDINDKMLKFKDKVVDAMDSTQMDWIDIYQNDHSHPSKIRRWPLFIFLFGAIICLGCSAIFHWFCVYSQQWSNFLNRLDYAGISILIAGSCYPPYFYFFYCVKTFALIYLTFITVFAVAVFIVSLRPDFTTPAKRKLRGSLFLILGLSTAFPMFHLAFFSHTIENFQAPIPLINWYLGGISYVVGALNYMLRFPEKCRPGRHCIWGSSHQIFHMFVLLGVILHYLGSLDAYYYRSTYKCLN